MNIGLGSRNPYTPTDVQTNRQMYQEGGEEVYTYIYIHIYIYIYVYIHIYMVLMHTNIYSYVHILKHTQQNMKYKGIGQLSACVRALRTALIGIYYIHTYTHT